MNKRLNFLLAAALFGAGAAPAAAAPQAKNIIFFLGDGMGPTTITAARIFRHGEDGLLQSEDIAEAIVYALTRPQRVSINEVLVRPTRQTR